MPLCTCGHETREHDPVGTPGEAPCIRCGCADYSPRPVVVTGNTMSHTDLPVSQGARDLYARLPRCSDEVDAALSVLCEADPRDVTNLLWARRARKL